jgi:hypothetical protein
MPIPGNTFDSRTHSNGAPPLPLFRPEAVLYQQQKAYGDIILIRPLSLILLTWLAIAIVSAVLAFLLFGHYTEKIHLQGSLVAVAATPDSTNSQAELYVPERWLGVVHPGTKLLLRCPACLPSPVEQEVLIKEISNAPIPSSDRTGVGPIYKALVLLPPQAAPAQDRSLMGRQVEAEILLRRKPLIKWLFERSGS